MSLSLHSKYCHPLTHLMAPRLVITLLLVWKGKEDPSPAQRLAQWGFGYLFKTNCYINKHGQDAMCLFLYYWLRLHSEPCWQFKTKGIFNILLLSCEESVSGSEMGSGSGATGNLEEDFVCSVWWAELEKAGMESHCCFNKVQREMCHCQRVSGWWDSVRRIMGQESGERR